MNRILLASHGRLAAGMKDTLELLVGKNDRIETLCAYVDDDSRGVARLIDTWDARRDPEDWWIVVTDVFGGSVNNEFLARSASDSFALVAGMNVSLLAELAVTLDVLDDAALDRAVEGCRAQIQRCRPTTMLTTEAGGDEDF
jgi:fructoselysine and glucoselysine-specific PTS system IIA component